jgi:MYXO-CTERM domain-containing protein
MLALGLVSTANAAPDPSRITIDVPSTERVSTTNLVSSARTVLMRSAGIPSQVQLSVDKQPRIGSTRVVRFQQTHQGLPVIARGAAIAIEPQGNVRLATSRVESRLPDSVTPALSAAKAAAIASARCGLPASAHNTRLVIWPTPQGGRLAYSVIPPSLLPIPYAPVVVVDAVTGGELSKTNLVRFKNLANMYEFNPVSSPNPIEVALPIGDGDITPQNELLVSYNCVDTQTTKRINAMGIDLTLHVCELQQNAQADATDGDYKKHVRKDDTSGGDPFSQLSIFYHAAKAYEFFRRFDPGFELEVTSKPLFLVANLMMPGGLSSFDLGKMSDPNLPLEPFANAFSAGYDPQMGQMMSMLWPEIVGGGLFFGQGERVDFAYDGDVVYHEFGHAVVGATARLVGYWHLDSQGATASPGAMNEALADYFSSAITNDPATGEYAAREESGNAIRHLDNSNTCPSNLAGEVHYDSEFFSAALWATRDGLATKAERFALDEAIFLALSTVSSGDLGYGDLAELFVAAVASSSLGQSVANDLKAAFESRGALPVCARIFDWTGKPIRSEAQAMGRAFISVGKSMLAGGGLLPYAPGLFQVRVPLPADAELLGVSFSELNRGGGAGGFPGAQGDAFKPAVIVSFDEAISFQAGVSTNAGDAVEADKSGGKYTAQLEVPAGATKAYVMLVNLGDSDGYFSSLAFDTAIDAPDAGADDASTANEDAGVDVPEPDAAQTEDAGTASGPGLSAAASDAAEGGCGCRAPGAAASLHGTGAAALLALFGALVARRRRTGTILS